MNVQSPSQLRTVHLIQPDTARPTAYALRFYATALKSMLGSHRLLLKNSPIYSSTFKLSGAEQQQWMDVFNMTADLPVHFTYANRAATMSLMRIIADHGINFKYLRHLQSDITFHNPVEVDELYTVSTELCDILVLRDDRAVLVTQTITESAVTGYSSVQKDYWAILKLPHRDIQELKSKQRFEHPDISQFQDLKMQQPVLTEAFPGVLVNVSNDMGLQYGKISGDLNPSHLYRAAAKVFCNSKPFIQGFCTVNYVIKYLTKLTSSPIHNVKITFIRPVYTGEQFTMRFSNHTFEICSAKGKLLAAGKWSKCKSSHISEPSQGVEFRI